MVCRQIHTCSKQTRKTNSTTLSGSCFVRVFLINKLGIPWMAAMISSSPRTMHACMHIYIYLINDRYNVCRSVDKLVKIQSFKLSVGMHEQQSSAKRAIETHMNATRLMVMNEIEVRRIRITQAKQQLLRDTPSRTTLPNVVGRNAELKKAYASIKQAASMGDFSSIGGGNKSKAVDSTVRKDFFGRPLAHKPSLNKTGVFSSNNGSQHQSCPHSLPKPKLWFKYNEGFTNAIRRSIKIRDLFSNCSCKATPIDKA